MSREKNILFEDEVSAASKAGHPAEAEGGYVLESGVGGWTQAAPPPAQDKISTGEQAGTAPSAPKPTAAASAARPAVVSKERQGVEATAQNRKAAQ